VIEFVDGLENISEVDFSRTRFMPSRHIRKMELPDVRDAVLNPPNQITLHDLNMVHIEQQSDMWTPDSLDQLHAVFHAIQEIARVILRRVKHLDHCDHSVRFERRHCRLERTNTTVHLLLS